jgi:DNA-binding helix-hairpin-helix protein with protein kinase domain
MLTSSTTQEMAAVQPEDKKKDQTSQFQELITESQNMASQGFDTKSAHDIARIINHEDAKVAAAVKKAIPEIAQVIDQVAKSARRWPADLHRSRIKRADCRARRLRMPSHLLHRPRSGAIHHGRRTQGAGLGRRSE